MNPATQQLIDALHRAVVLMEAAINFVQDNDLGEYTVYYDDAECDGSCLADDCDSAIDDAKRAIAAAQRAEVAA
jgi:hypothetical protein